MNVYFGAITAAICFWLFFGDTLMNIATQLTRIADALENKKNDKEEP